MIRVKARIVLKQLVEGLPLLAEGYIKDATLTARYFDQYSGAELVRLLVGPPAIGRHALTAVYFEIDTVMTWPGNLAIITFKVEAELIRMAKIWKEQAQDAFWTAEAQL